MHRIRGWSVAVLLIVGIVLAPIALAGIWAKSVLSDTDTYVSTVAPLATDPAGTAALEDRLVTAVTDAVASISDSDQVDEYLSGLNMPDVVKGAIGAGLSALVEALREPAANAIHELVSSPGFADLWQQVNLVAHEKFIGIMDGDSALLDSDGNIALQLEPVLEQVRERLVSNGHEWASDIPTTDAQYVLVQADDVDTLRTYYNMLSGWTIVAIVVTLVALIGTMLLAREKRRAVARTFAALAFMMVVFRLLLGFGVSALGERVQNPDATRAIFTTVTTDLVDWIRLVAVVSVLIALVAVAWGKRNVIQTELESVRRTLANPPVLRITRIISGLVALVGGVWLLFADHQSVAPVVLVALVTLGASLLAAMPGRLLLEREPTDREQVQQG